MSDKERRDEILKLILGEREDQLAIWGWQTRNDPEWLVILMEEVGEASKEILEESPTSYHVAFELIQSVAVGVAWLEDLFKKNPEIVVVLREHYKNYAKMYDTE